jgi:hypothetical protein
MAFRLANRERRCRKVKPGELIESFNHIIPGVKKEAKHG